MTWKYEIRTGDLYAPDGKLEGRGYSGHGLDVNQPAAESHPASGPIPRGKYRIGPARTSANTGVITMNLDPEPGTETWGRSLLRMHGDNRLGNRSASHGCVVMGRAIRLAVAASPDKELEAY